MGEKEAVTIDAGILGDNMAAILSFFFSLLFPTIFTIY